MLCTTTRASVSADVSTGSMWLLIGVVLKSFGYYYTALDENDDIVWVVNIFMAIIASMVFVSVHRMKVSRIRLSLADGEEEWSTAACLYTMGVCTYFGSIMYILKFDHVAVAIHVLFAVSLLMDVLSYVYFIRFSHKADDRYGTDTGI